MSQEKGAVKKDEVKILGQSRAEQNRTGRDRTGQGEEGESDRMKVTP